MGLNFFFAKVMISQKQNLKHVWESMKHFNRNLTQHFDLSTKWAPTLIGEKLNDYNLENVYE